MPPPGGRQQRAQTLALQRASRANSYDLPDPLTLHHELCAGAGEHSWVLRGDTVTRLENTADGFQEVPESSFRLLPPFAEKTNPVGIRQALLTKNETQLLAMSRDVANCLIQADLQTGQVTRVWTPRKSSVPLSLAVICTETPAAQLDNRDTFLALGPDCISRWDLRAPPGLAQKLTNTGFRKFPSTADPAFSCIATAGDGRFVIGTRGGELHLYPAEPLRQWTIATTEFQTGAPLSAVDITFDGHWILATSDYFLCVVPTQFRTACGLRNGFEYTVGLQMEGAATKLVLHEGDQRLVHDSEQGVQAFRKAHFDWITEAGSKERRIVALCGAYVVAWNWDQVKRAMKAGHRRMTNHHLICQAQVPGPMSMVQDTAFMHEAFLDERTSNQLAIASPANVYNVRFNK